MTTSDEARGTAPPDPVQERRQALEVLDRFNPKERSVLRATVARMLPREVRVGLNIALDRIYDALYNEGIGEMTATAVAAMSAAILEDLRMSLQDMESALSDAEASQLSRDEAKLVGGLAELATLLAEQVGTLDQALGKVTSAQGKGASYGY